MCIDNLYGLRAGFAHALCHSHPSKDVTAWAELLVRADMGHPSVGRYMPEHYHTSVNRARRWLRDASIRYDDRIAAE